MTNEDIPESFKDKLSKALRNKAVLGERSKLLAQQVEDLRTREQMMHHIASELLERQRELNYMLHRASSVLHTLQDTNLALSAEFTHIVKELPPAKDGDWEQTIERVNQLFKKTHELAGGMQEEIFRNTSEPKPPKKQGKAAKERSAERGAAEPESKPQVEMVEPQFAAQLEPELQPEVVGFHLMAELETEPQVEAVEPQLAVQPEPQIELTEPELAAEPEPEPQVEFVEPQLVAEPEPEPMMEIAEPELAVEPEPGPEMEIAEPEFVPLPKPEPEMEAAAYEFGIESEREPQAFGETEVTAIEEPAVEVEEEAPIKPVPEFDKARDEQIERMFRQIQPIELKPLPIGRQAAQQGFFSKLFRRDKTPV